MPIAFQPMPKLPKIRRKILFPYCFEVLPSA